MSLPKRDFLAFLCGLLASSFWGCSVIMSQSGFSSPSELLLQTREEAREKLGDPDEIKICPGGQTIEHFWIRIKLSSAWADSTAGDLFKATFGLSEIILFPMAIYESDKQKLHHAFVWDENGKLLFRYDLKTHTQPQQQFHQIIWPLLLQKICIQEENENYGRWSGCVSKYISDIRQWGTCIGYSPDSEEESALADILTVCEWTESGQVTVEEVIWSSQNGHPVKQL